MTTNTAYFLDFEVENDQPRENSAAASTAGDIDNFLKSAEIKYHPSKIHQALALIGKIILLIIAPAEYYRTLTEAEREEIGIKL